MRLHSDRGRSLGESKLPSVPSITQLHNLEDLVGNSLASAIDALALGSSQSLVAVEELHSSKNDDQPEMHSTVKSSIGIASTDNCSTFHPDVGSQPSAVPLSSRVISYVRMEPSRALILLNIENVDPELLQIECMSHGSLRYLESVFHKTHGVGFVAYHDLSAAEDAKRHLGERLTSAVRQRGNDASREVEVHFSVALDITTESSLCKSTLELRRVPPEIGDEKIRQVFSSFGKLRAFQAEKNMVTIDFMNTLDAYKAVQRCSELYPDWVSNPKQDWVQIPGKSPPPPKEKISEAPDLSFAQQQQTNSDATAALELLALLVEWSQTAQPDDVGQDGSDVQANNGPSSTVSQWQIDEEELDQADECQGLSIEDDGPEQQGDSPISSGRGLGNLGEAHDDAPGDSPGLSLEDDDEDIREPMTTTSYLSGLKLEEGGNRDRTSSATSAHTMEGCETVAAPPSSVSSVHNQVHNQHIHSVTTAGDVGIDARSSQGGVGNAGGRTGATGTTGVGINIRRPHQLGAPRQLGSSPPTPHHVGNYVPHPCHHASAPPPPVLHVFNHAPVPHTQVMPHHPGPIEYHSNHHHQQHFIAASMQCHLSHVPVENPCMCGQCLEIMHYKKSLMMHLPPGSSTYNSFGPVPVGLPCAPIVYAPVGHHQTGHHHTGHHHVGHHQTGHHQTGHHQTGHHQTGHYQTGQPPHAHTHAPLGPAPLPHGPPPRVPVGTGQSAHPKVSGSAGGREGGGKQEHERGSRRKVGSRDSRPAMDYSLRLELVTQGIDRRTTVMVRNIPNKYTQTAVLDEINDSDFSGSYDFFYLPIDFKNKCNVGYAFINFIEFRSIVPFVDKYQGRRWNNFNSEKVCAISYARIQGKASMITRFQNSSLMDKAGEYRPLLFQSTGSERGLPELFPAGNYNRCRNNGDRGKKS